VETRKKIVRLERRRKQIQIGLTGPERLKLEAIALELEVSLGEAARVAISQYALRNQQGKAASGRI
jgi:hypothetical protein